MNIPLLSRAERAVFAAIHAAPDTHVSAIARHLGIRQCVANSAVIQLERAGLIVTRLEGRRYCRPAPWTVSA